MAGGADKKKSIEGLINEDEGDFPIRDMVNEMAKPDEINNVPKKRNSPAVRRKRGFIMVCS